MSLHDDIEAQVAKADTPTRCRLGLILDEVDLADLDALQYAIERVRKEKDDPKSLFSVAWLTQLLNKNDYKIGKTVVSEHVRKVCACVRSGK